MRLRRYSEPEAFQVATADFLGTDEAKNNLILGLTNSLINGEFRDHPPYLATIEASGQIVMVGFRTPPHSLILSTVAPQHRTESVFKLLIDDVLTEYGVIEKVNGIAEIAAPFVEQLGSVSGRSYELHMAQRIYKLERVIPPDNVPGKLRRAQARDLDLMVDWIIAFNRDTWGEEPDSQRVRTRLGQTLATDPRVRGLMLWEVDGTPVSLVGYSGPTPNGIRVAPVYTPPDLRGRGYASACTAATSQMLLDEGRKFCFLYTDLSNPTSNKIYMNIGYEPVCDVNDYEMLRDLNRSE